MEIENTYEDTYCQFLKSRKSKRTAFRRDSCRRKMRMWMWNNVRMHIQWMCRVSRRMQTRAKLKCCILLGWPHKAQHINAFAVCFVDLVTPFCLLLLRSVCKSCCYLGACPSVCVCVGGCGCMCCIWILVMHSFVEFCAFFCFVFRFFLNFSLAYLTVCSRHIALLQHKQNQVQWLRFGLR